MSEGKREKEEVELVKVTKCMKEDVGSESGAEASKSNAVRERNACVQEGKEREK